MALFTVDDARAFDKQQLADEQKYPDDAILAAHDRIAASLANVCGTPFIPESRTAVVDGSGTYRLMIPDLLPLTVTTVELRGGDGVFAADTVDLAVIELDDAGFLDRYDGACWVRGWRNYRVTYTHGWATVPLEIARAALGIAIIQLIPTDLPAGVTTLSSGEGTFTVSTAGQSRNPFSQQGIYGVPWIDEIVYRYKLNVPAVG